MKGIKSWTGAFSRSALGNKVFFVKGGRDGWERMKHELDKHLTFDGYDAAYPGGDIEGFTFVYGVGDGGVYYTDGNWFFGKRGMWVVGFQALRITCLLNDIGLPRKLKGENNVPDQEELIRTLKGQQVNRGEQVLLQAMVMDFFQNM